MPFIGNIREDKLLGESVIRSVEEWDAELSSDRGMAGTLESHRRNRVRKVGFILLCLIGVFIILGIAVTVGPYNIGFLESYQIILDHIMGNYDSGDIKDYIIINYRLPRIVAGIFCGAGLAVCGVVMQSVLKNPLADPYTTGVSSGASLGATLAMTMGSAASAASPHIVIFAFFFSLIPTAMMIAISKMRNASPTTMIMAGIGVMYIFNAVTTVLMLWADPQDLSRIYQWQVGTLETITWTSAPIIIVVTVIGMVVIELLSGKLNVLATGDDNAKSIGINADNMRILMLCLVGLVTAVVVSFTGLIGFVGLVTPHIARLFIGSDNRFLIPASALLGGIILVAADIVSRSFVEATLRVGVVMAFIGGPVFLWLLVRSKNSMWG